ncbi:MAG: transcriptional regulator [Alphaproteobacteria bacterium]|nr:transcriptional regulator [Alphaproteobacteria bacterium]
MKVGLSRTLNEDEAAIAEIGGSRNKIGDPTGKAGQIATIMEQRLMLGAYQPGEMLSFNMLADEFKVSRQPVSVAISHLRASGYVEVLPQVGCRVVHPSLPDIVDFFTVLGKIESTVAAMAAKRHEPNEGKLLLKLDPPQKLSNMAAIANRRAYIAYVDKFHDMLWKMARTPLLESKIAGLRRLSNFYLWQGMPTLAPSAAKTLISERTEIAKAIVARDSRRAAALMERHISEKPQIIFA